MTTSTDAAAAAEIAVSAGRILLELRAGGGQPDQLRTVGDARSHDLIASELARRFANDAILSEEATDQLGRLDCERVWIVDPLDGTREFSEPSRDDWAVHVALVADGDLVAGAVALPAVGAVYTSH